jgi:hypothetical protein
MGDRCCLAALFFTALVALERNRRGEAAMESMSPDKLVLRIRSVHSCGHMAVEGSIGCHVQREHSHPWHALHFGFEFDRSYLAKAVERVTLNETIALTSRTGREGAHFSWCSREAPAPSLFPGRNCATVGNRRKMLHV